MPRPEGAAALAGLALLALLVLQGVTLPPCDVAYIASPSLEGHNESHDAEHSFAEGYMEGCTRQTFKEGRFFTELISTMITHPRCLHPTSTGLVCLRAGALCSSRARCTGASAPQRSGPGPAGQYAWPPESSTSHFTLTERREVGPGLLVNDFAGDYYHQVAYTGVFEDANPTPHTSSDVVAELLGSTGTCAPAKRHFSSQNFQKYYYLLLVSFAVLRYLDAPSFNCKSDHSRGFRPGYGAEWWDPGDAGRRTNRCGGGCFSSCVATGERQRGARRLL